MADAIARVQLAQLARELQVDEVRVLLQRHGNHQNNILVQDSIDRTYAQGELLGRLGFQPTVSRSSSSLRAVWTNLVLLSGISNALKQLDQIYKIPNVSTEPALDDFASQVDPELLERLKAYKAESDLEGDAIYWQFCQEDQGFCSELRRRGLWAARAIMKLVTKYPGQTILATSHGVAVLETAITHLSVFGQDKPPADELIQNPAHKLSCGQIAELIFRDDRLVEVNFFPAP